MPELPEIETIRRGLDPHLTGRRVTAAEARRANLRTPLPPDLGARLTGRSILPLGRRAKYLLIPLDDGQTLIIHLGMSGRLVLEKDDQRAIPGEFHREIDRLVAHDHVVIRLDDGQSLILNDPRRFGSLDLVETARLDAHPALAKLGPEPLGNAFHEAALAEAFSGRKGPVKTALLDQAIVAGLGNIYVCEALHRAGIAPDRAAGSLKAKEIARLVPLIRAVLDEAIAAGGSTLRDFRHGDGGLGYFQHRFRAYDREGEACTMPGCKGQIGRILQSGRSTFFCASCQR